MTVLTPRRRLAFSRLASSTISRHAAIRTFGGFYFDFSEDVFCWVDPATREVTSYTDFAAMFTDLGSITSSEKYIWNAGGMLTLIPANTVAQPAYTIDGQLLGISVESAKSKNNLVYSEDFSQSNWTKTGVTLTSNTDESPREDTTASTITEDSSTGNHWLLQSATSQGGNTLTYTASGFVKTKAGARFIGIRVDDGSGNGLECVFDLTTGVTTVSGVGTPYTNARAWLDVAGSTDYFRVSLTFTKNTGTTVNFAIGMADGTSMSYAGDGTSAIVLWGLELKQNSGGALAQSETRPTSYVKTTSAPVTRAADVITFAMPSALQDASAYSIHTTAYLPRAPGGMQCVFCSLNNADDSQRIYIYQAGTTFSSQLQGHIDGSASLTLTISPASHFDEQVGIAFIAQPLAHWMQSTFKGTTNSISSAFPTDTLTTIRLGTYDPTATTVGSHMGVSSLAIFPLGQRRTLMQKLLFDTPFVNPDRITGPNYMSQDMLGDVVPAVADGYEIFHGPAGLPPSDSTPNTSYNYLPITVAYAGALNGTQDSTCTTAKFAYLQWMNRNNGTLPVHFVGTISGTTLTVTSTDGPIGSGQIFTGAAAGTYITDTPAHGGPGAYTVNISQTIGTPTTFTQPANLTAFNYNSLPGAGLIMADGSSAALQYPTFDRANAATMLAALYVNLYPDRDASPPPSGQWYNAYLQPVEDIFGTVTIDQPGSRVVTYAYASANREALFTQRATAGIKRFAYATDLYVIPDGQFFSGTALIWGSIADFEMADKRLASRTTPFVQQMALIHHNADIPTKFGMLPDPITGSGKLCGLSGIDIPNKPANCDVNNLGDIATAVDFFNVIVQNPAPAGFTVETALDLCYAAFGTPSVDFPPSHLGIGFVMGVWPGGTTMDDAQLVHDFIVDNGLGGIQTGPVIGQRNRWTVQKWLTVLGLPT